MCIRDSFRRQRPIRQPSRGLRRTPICRHSIPVEESLSNLLERLDTNQQGKSSASETDVFCIYATLRSTFVVSVRHQSHHRQAGRRRARTMPGRWPHQTVDFAVLQPHGRDLEERRKCPDIGKASRSLTPSAPLKSTPSSASARSSILLERSASSPCLTWCLTSTKSPSPKTSLTLYSAHPRSPASSTKASALTRKLPAPTTQHHNGALERVNHTMAQKVAMHGGH